MSKSITIPARRTGAIKSTLTAIATTMEIANQELNLLRISNFNENVNALVEDYGYTVDEAIKALS